MLKTVSSITNAIGALNYKGTWDANANSPALTSSVGTKGDYYVVGTAGSTTLNGISNWGIGDWAAFNGSVWQRVEGGANLNGVDLSVSGTSTLSGLTASTALALNASKEVVSVTNTGTGNNVLATAPTLVGDVNLSTGNLVIGTSGKGIDFSITSHPAGMTSELLADYEEGTWTPTWSVSGGTIAAVNNEGFYTKVGRQVFVGGYIAYGNSTTGTPTGALSIAGLPYTSSTGYGQGGGKQAGRGYAGYGFWLITPQTTLGIAASSTSLDLSAVYTDMSRGFSNSDQVYFFATYFV
jgi:hypothetical protein